MIKNCLAIYERLSGQAVNFQKSNICFSKNTRPEVRHEVAQFLQVNEASDFGKYLGLPSFIGRNKRLVFSYIEEKVSQRITGWHKKFLSKAGKEILLKTVAQALPIYAMSVFLLSDSLCSSIQRCMNKFWWNNGSSNDGGIHWLAWDKMCVPKKCGGLGFKDLHTFNLALLAKQGWRFLKHPASLAARIFKARYFPQSDFLAAKMGPNPSFIWRSIMATHGFIRSKALRRIGNGKDTLVWGHPWLCGAENPWIQTPKPTYLPDVRVDQLRDPNSGSWDIDCLHEFFSQEECEFMVIIL